MNSRSLLLCSLHELPLPQPPPQSGSEWVTHAGLENQSQRAPNGWEKGSFYVACCCRAAAAVWWLQFFRHWTRSVLGGERCAKGVYYWEEEEKSSTKRDALRGEREMLLNFPSFLHSTRKRKREWSRCCSKMATKNGEKGRSSEKRGC